MQPFHRLDDGPAAGRHEALRYRTAIYLQGLQQARRRRAAELQLEQVPDPHDGLSQEAV